MARTAVIAKTATAVSHNTAAKMDAKAAAQQAAQTPAAEPAAAAPGGMTPEKIAMLTQLSELKTQGVLSEAEFEVQKAKLLHG